MKSSKTILVTGGAGYIGRIFVETLKEAGFTPLVIDNFSTGHRESVRGICYEECDLSKEEEVSYLLFRLPPIEAIFHFAAKALVSESCQDPIGYLQNNVQASLQVGRIMREKHIPYLVHSSSCAVYGMPKTLPIQESDPMEPMHPYGESKKLSELLLNQLAVSSHFKVVHLRYFNPAGSLRGKFGEHHEPETHLIPAVIRAATEGDDFCLYGDTYPTVDGSAVRDLIHIEDLLEAHMCAFRYLEMKDSPVSSAFNIGCGKGITVKEVIQSAEKLFGKKIKVKTMPNRPGDPPALYASVDRAKSVLTWEPHKTLEDMLQDHALFLENSGMMPSPSKEDGSARDESFSKRKFKE